LAVVHHFGKALDESYSLCERK
ncbi:unnamed protein product, partial [Rotaria sp. Silwood2]